MIIEIRISGPKVYFLNQLVVVYDASNKSCRMERWWCGMRHLSAVMIVAHSTPGSSRHIQHTGCLSQPCSVPRPEQQSWTRRTYVSVLPFLLAPFGLLQGCFRLHPVMHKVKVRGGKHQDKRKSSGCR